MHLISKTKPTRNTLKQRQPAIEQTNKPAMLLVVAAHGVGQRTAAVRTGGQLAAGRLVGALGLVVWTLAVHPRLHHLLLLLLRALLRDHRRHLRERDGLALTTGVGRAQTAQVLDVARGAARAYEPRESKLVTSYERQEVRFSR